MIKGAVDKLLSAQRALGLPVDEEHREVTSDLDGDVTAIIEATLAPRSHIVGRSLEEVRFRDRYGFTALAIWRQGAVITQRLQRIPLLFGDALLCHVPWTAWIAAGDPWGQHESRS